VIWLSGWQTWGLLLFDFAVEIPNCEEIHVERLCKPFLPRVNAQPFINQIDLEVPVWHDDKAHIYVHEVEGIIEFGWPVGKLCPDTKWGLIR
jgi:hypothetical protein